MTTLNCMRREKHEREDQQPGNRKRQADQGGKVGTVRQRSDHHWRQQQSGKNLCTGCHCMGTGRRQVQAYGCGKGWGIHRSHSTRGTVQRSDCGTERQEQQPESHRPQRQQVRTAAAELLPVRTGAGSAQVHERIEQGESGNPTANYRCRGTAGTDRI